MRYFAVISLLIAPMWLVKTLWAKEFLVDGSVKYLEDNAHCIAVFAALSETENDALRSQLELEVDDEYYSSEAVEQRAYKFADFLGKHLFTRRRGSISLLDQSYITVKMKDIVNREYFYIKNAWVSNGALFFDQLYLECVKQFNALQ